MNARFAQFIGLMLLAAVSLGAQERLAGTLTGSPQD
jgi:hypothetical protein